MALLDHLEKLPAFVGAAHTGSIRGYAQSRGLSQPALSKAIRALETELETPLLLRSKEGVALTPSGRRLLQFAERLLLSATETENEIRSRALDQLKGHFTLGTYHSIGVYFLPALMRHVMELQAGLRLDFVTASSAALVESLLASRVDFIISVSPPQKPQLIHDTLYEETYSLYRPAADPPRLARRRIFTLLSAKDGRGRSMRSYLEAADLLDEAVSCGDFECAKTMCEQGLGWAVLPERVAASLVGFGKLQRVSSLPALQTFGPHRIVFSCLRHHQADRSVRWLSDQVHSVVRQNRSLDAPMECQGADCAPALHVHNHLKARKKSIWPNACSVPRA